VFVSSILGLQSAPLQGIYGMTKAAVISLTKTLAVELGPAGIRVNAIAPGLVDTKLASAITGSPELRKMFEERTPLGRIAVPDEIAGTLTWLASDDARYVTGQVIAIDGGYTVR
jgi:NAD(P)-dependent dehydrogenase (short-subunit alcohol dehydrogenase family)